MSVKEKLQELITILREEEKKEGEQKMKEETQPEVEDTPGEDIGALLLSKEDSAEFIRIRNEIIQNRHLLGALVIDYETKKVAFLKKADELNEVLLAELANIKDGLEFDEEDQVEIGIHESDPQRIFVREK